MEPSSLLAIPLAQPWRLFTIGTGPAIQARFRALVNQWHPDRPGGRRDVFEHVVALRERALTMAGRTGWGADGPLGTASTVTAPRPDFDTYRTMGPLEAMAADMAADEVGQIYSLPRLVRYLAPSDQASRVMRAIRSIGLMGTIMGAAGGSHLWPRPIGLPEKRRHPTSGMDCLAMDLECPSGFRRLRSVLKTHGGTVEPEVAIRVLRRACDAVHGLQAAGLMHGDISLDTLFVDRDCHDIALLGGWWMSAPLGQAIDLLPWRTISVVPSPVLRQRIGDTRIDIECLRQLGRELLGDSLGEQLSTRVDIPAGLRRWLSGELH